MPVHQVQGQGKVRVSRLSTLDFGLSLPRTISRSISLFEELAPGNLPLVVYRTCQSWPVPTSIPPGLLFSLPDTCLYLCKALDVESRCPGP